jgi:homoserine dehydrogenase
MLKPLRLLIAGFGTVGQGLAELLAGRADIRVLGIADRRYGNVLAEEPLVGLDLWHVLQLLRAGQPLSRAGVPFTGDVLALLAEPRSRAANVLIEVTDSNFDTGRPALDYISAALERGLHVATTNKGPLANDFAGLVAQAERRGLLLELEGTVMSGTPVIKLCRELRAGTDIVEVRGIVNGTVNFILTRMQAGGTYASALAEAQALGIAEADPAGDVDGWDAAAKVAILANVAFKAPLTIHQVSRQGIRDLSPADMDRACQEKKVWKLVARLAPTADGVEGHIRPELLDCTDPLARIEGVQNALEIRTTALGTLLLAGPGAGGIETGFALLSDLIKIQGQLSA